MTMRAQPASQAAYSGAPAGKAARFARCLCLAASPSFAMMALICTIAGDADPVCSAMRGVFPVNGMAAMYWLMAVFHLPAWIERFRQR
jgi:hypothetical protein